MKKTSEGNKKVTNEESSSQDPSKLPPGATVEASSVKEKIKAFNVGNSSNVAHVSGTQAKSMGVVSATLNQGNVGHKASVPPPTSSTPMIPVASVSDTVVEGELHVSSTVINNYQMGLEWPLAAKEFDREIPPSIKALYASYQTRCQNAELAQALAYYVLSEATHLLGSEKRFDLEREVKLFLSDKNTSPLLLIQGDSGSGKSLYANLLEQQLWQAYDSKQATSYIPIFIELKSIDFSAPRNFIHQLLKEQYGYTVQQIQQLRDQLSCVFILDGYDEMSMASDGRSRVIYLENELSKWHAKLIVTCRTQYLNNLSSYQYLFSTTQNSTMVNNSFEEIFIALFSTTQIDAYLKNYTEKQIANADVKKDLEKLDSLSSMQEFIQSPLLLKIVIEILPELKKLQTQKNNQRVTRADIYDLFIRKWFERENLRAAIKAQNPYGLFGEFSERLAFMMFLEGVTEVDYKPVERSQNNSNEWEQFFNSQDPEIIRKRAGCPLRRIGEGRYSFYHKSFMEYFVAMYLYEEWGLGEKDDKIFQARFNTLKQLIAESNPGLNKKLLIQDPTVIEFLADKIKHNEKAIERLLSMVMASKKNPTISNAAANAITIAKIASMPRSPFSGKDFSYVHIAGANLDRAILHHTDLSHADLTGVSLHNAFLGDGNLRYSNLKNIQFGNLPVLSLGKITCIDFDIYSDLIASATNCEIKICAWKTREVLYILEGHSAPISSVRFSRRGQFLISCSYSGPEICLWNISTKKLVRKIVNIFSFPMTRDMSFDLNHNCTRLIVGFELNSIFLLDIQTGDILHEFKTIGENRAVYFSSDDSIVISLSREKMVGMPVFAPLSLETTAMSVFAPPRPEATAMAVVAPHFLKATAIVHDAKQNNRFPQSPASSTSTPIDSPYSINLWDINSGSLIDSYTGITNFTLDEDHRMLAFSKGSIFQVIDISSRKPLCAFEFEISNAVSDACFNFDGKTLAFSSQDGKVKLLDLKSGKQIEILADYSKVKGLWFSGSGKILMVKRANNVVNLWDMTSIMLILSLHIVEDTRISYDGKHILSHINSSNASKVQIWDLNVVKTLETDDYRSRVTTNIKCIRFSHDGRFIAMGSSEGVIFVWDSCSSELLFVLQDRAGSVTDICFSHNGKMLISCHVKTIRLWDLITGKLLSTYKEISSPVQRIVFSHDDTAFITVGIGIMNIWDIVLKKEIHKFQFPVGSYVDFSEDTKNFIAAFTDAQLWDMQLMNKIYSFNSSNTGKIYCVRFSHSGKMIAMGGYQFVSLWDVASGELKKIIKGHFKGSVQTIAFNHDDTLLATVELYHSNIDLFEIASGKIVASIENRLSSIADLCFNPKSSQLLVHYSQPDQPLELWEQVETPEGSQWLIVWRSSYPQLYCKGCNIEDVTDLSDVNYQFLEQQGAVVSKKQKAQDFLRSAPSFFEFSKKKIEKISDKLESAPLSPKSKMQSLKEKTKNRMTSVFSPLKGKAEELPKKLEKKTGFSIFKSPKDEVKNIKSLEKDKAADLPKDEEEEIKQESNFKSK